MTAVAAAAAAAAEMGKSGAMAGMMPVRAASIANQTTEMAPHPQLRARGAGHAGTRGPRRLCERL